MTALASWIPRSFIELHREGRFDYWGVSYDELTEAERMTRARTRRPRVLWWSGIEWDRTPEDISAFGGDDYLRPGLHPFAGDGMGGLYCWYPKWKTPLDEEPPIIFVPRESEEADVFARRFSECLVRCLLRDFATATDAQITLAERTQTWKAQAAIIEPYLSDSQLAVLRLVEQTLSPPVCAEADRATADAIGRRSLVAVQLPTRYDVDVRQVGVDTVASLYKQSIRFYRELVEEEGLVEFSGKLSEAESQLTDLEQRA